MGCGACRTVNAIRTFLRALGDYIMVHAVDLYVGKRIRYRRWLIGITQQELADHVGIKFQQIQKYETGANRVSASRLWDISEKLGVPINFFFEDLEKHNGEKNSFQAFSSDMFRNKEAIDLIRSYFSIPENQRRKLFDLARVLSDFA